MIEIPAEVVGAFGWQAAAIAPLHGGLINETFVVRVAGSPVAVLQRLHAIFGATVNHDLAAVTEHLHTHGMLTPHLIRTADRQAFVTIGTHVWRALTWIDGETIHAIPDPSWAEAGGELVGRFHVAVADLVHDYAFTRTGVHDTEFHLSTLASLRGAVADSPPGSDDREAHALAGEILGVAAELPSLPALPRRHCHGDLKISNLLFRDGRGIALVDLDTLGRGTMAFELGDAMRSWCNPRGEDAGAVRFDLAIFEAAMRGFRRAGAAMTTDEWRSIVIGLEIVSVELAARFAVDVFRDEYFGWDRARFPSRRAHNLVRARGQLALGLAVRDARRDALAIVLAGT